ncbi:MAG: alanine dehydrogenase [Pseudomonadota bacterium]|nr:alanine dehydrogenase [Pseudomonadota bacterium]
MDIGVPRECKTQEYRVGLIPTVVRALVAAGHRVWVEQGCGLGAGFGDDDYRAAGARVVATAEEVWGGAGLIVKVKEPQRHECALLRPGQVIFTYLHLAADPGLVDLLLASGCIAIAYETVTNAEGRLPLLTPMSQIAGRIAVQAGAHYLEKSAGGRGVLLSGLDGAPPGKVVILGGGNVGGNAARIALGMGAEVTVFDALPARLEQLGRQFGPALACLPAEPARVEEAVLGADLVIGSVLIPGAAAPKVVSAEVVEAMAAGTVLVDVAIDQGGCFATSRPTSLDDPVYLEHGVIHYCVTNMPSTVARTATLALNHITGPAVLAMAEQGVDAALKANPHLRDGVNLYRGELTHRAVAESLGRPWRGVESLLG